MVFWILLAVMTVLAALAVIVPLLRAGKDPATAAAHDVAVYKDQLAELEKDLEDGLISVSEAEAARTEIARRLLKASEAAAPERPKPRAWRRSAAIAVSVLGIPAMSLALYFLLGSPDLPDQPLSARQQNPHQGQDVAKMIKGAEAYLTANPNDGTAWALLGPVYLRINRGADAANAFRKAIELVGSDAKLETGLGEALVMMAGGTVGPDAKAAFERALKHDPKAVEPRFFLAVALNQERRYTEAVAAWENFLKDSDPRQPWVPYARQELKRAKQGAGLPVDEEAPSAASPPGPTSEDVAAARDLSAGDRQAMIEGMVSRLDERLTADGGSVEDWIRLIRAYMVLERKDDARTTAQKALNAYDGDNGSQARIKEAASGLGIAL